MVLFIDYYFLSLLLLYFSSFLFFFLNERNPFLILILLEFQLIMLALLFIYFSYLNHSVLGYIFALFIIAFAGAEASVGISLLIVFYRIRGLFSVYFPSALERVQWKKIS
nr:NADH dehydrogenase subunit 4L [Balamuthia mandrillaris]AKT93822.1 NADH dehydrogenase subunit 4L [Balamuthia mandrillaris]AKT93898.1 NADH dehydrogenase subunit 4L [Balamuthia mandrillaris]